MSTELDIDFNSLLCNLSDAQLDHLSVGLEHAFGVQLAGNAHDTEPFSLLPESGKIVALDSRTLSVMDVWKTAEKLST